MPFIITEPQRIEGTNLGFAVYPYSFYFQDHIDRSERFDNKLKIFKLKDSKFLEIERTVFETKYLSENVPKLFVDATLKNFVDKHKECVIDSAKVENFFQTNISFEETFSK